MKILSIVGARPQFVKAAVFRKYCDENGVEEILLHTGQHYDPEMSTKIFDELGVRKPDLQHQLLARSHGGMTAEILKLVESAIIDLNPDIVNVYGDTNSTLAGALAAAKLNVPIGHVEAGLRSFNKKMPEEINRILTDHVSSFLFCPTFDALNNLKNENLSNGVYVVGDIMYDAIKEFSSFHTMPNLSNIDKKKPLAVLTIHRAENINSLDRCKKILEFCETFCDTYNVIFPVHPNTKNKIDIYNLNISRFSSCSPLNYLEIQGLLAEAELVLTDSGGLQKEAYFHGCECITLRDETEWNETIKHGWNRLWTNLNGPKIPKNQIQEYGCGDTAQKILDVYKGEANEA